MPKEQQTIAIGNYIFTASPRKSLTFDCFFSNLTQAIAKT
jgi:hypothetical protein